MQAFCRGSLLEYRGLKPIPPFFEGRSDAACRVVIRLHAVPVDARMGVNGGRCGNPPNDLAAKPTVGAGSSQCEDSPAHRHPPPYAQIAPMKDPTVFVATRRAASRSKTPRRTLKHHRTPNHRTAPQTAASPLTPHRAPNAPPSPHLPHTNVLPTSYLGRFMFGFGLKAKSEDAVELVLSWYGEGMGESPCRYRALACHTARIASRCDTRTSLRPGVLHQHHPHRGNYLDRLQ